MTRFILLLTVVLFWGTGALIAEEAASDTAVVAAFDVQAGRLVGSATKDQKTIWTEVQALVPPPLLALVDRVEFFEDRSGPNSETSTDGYASLNEEGDAFTLGLSLDSAKTAFVDRDPEALAEYRRTLYHELGHMISFQPSQRDQTGSVTGTLVLDEGTLVPGAYLNRFYEQFWKKAYPGRDASTRNDAEGAAFFAAHPGAFVTEYAATGPLEDFAESFALFVTAPLPAGGAEKDKKVRFFSAWPELTSLRSTIQASLQR